MKSRPEHNLGTTEPCRRLRLAQGAVASVEECSCGLVQLNLGAVTLRFAPEAFNELVGTLEEALAVYRDRQRAVDATDEVNVFRSERGDA